ncbi:hypothetical protein [Nonomuraea gerenzanensis]|uniref:Uncharacterized protein n=1 Tax=Nonomuraea gerenzanensis TaxID=93944 RepID=A0A1M4EGN6_9ACTN|nr:hypothetical protein [Nonomuraea gerenzanensis]UBU09700.1 hypothetical protein LCN96_35765 [Nonomuraea gerenzanensis]SBO98137.1 hypothetical protein BN4615_P7653 [Nonomuraea gerenzanensis]
MSLELPAALAAVEAFLGRPFPEGDEDALVRRGDDYEERPGAGVVEGLGLKASAGIVLARKGVALLQYGLIAAALAETLATGGTPAPVLRRAGQQALDACVSDDGTRTADGG